MGVGGDLTQEPIGSPLAAGSAEGDTNEAWGSGRIVVVKADNSMMSLHHALAQMRRKALAYFITHLLGGAPVLGLSLMESNQEPQRLFLSLDTSVIRYLCKTAVILSF